jgi:hypothetical protein
MTKVHVNSKQVVAAFLLTLSLGCAKTSFAPDLLDESTATTGATKTISSSEVVAPANNLVDFLLVLDDSNSMLPELKKLSSRMATFVSFLEAAQIDWQMCVTTTRGSLFGTYLPWNGYVPTAGTPNFVLTKGHAGLSNIFTSTIDTIAIGGGDSGDERALKSTFVSFKNGGPCYRPGAAVSVITISDEDERSVNGDPKKLKSKDAPGSLLPLEFEDIPENVVAQAQSSFGANVRFTFNSIIVKPGDRSCEALQDADVSPSHPAYAYTAMSALTNGGVGSICDADYSANLNTFKDKIVNSLHQLSLQCEPVKDTLKIWVNKHRMNDFKFEKNIVRFNRELVEGTQIDLVYDCQE